MSNDVRLRFKTLGLTGTVDIKDRYKFGYIKAWELVCLKAYRDQYKNGKALISDSRVQDLLEIGIEKVLTNVLNPIALSYSGRLVQGNHRRGGVEIALAAGILDPNFEIPYIQDLCKQTMHDQSISAILGNVGGNRVNLETQAVMGKHKLAEKVYYPIYEAFKMTSTNLSNVRLCALSMKLGAILNRNPTLVTRLKSGGKLNISGHDIYQAKNYPEANKLKFFNAEAHIDLRGHSEALAKLLANGMSLIKDLHESGVWSNRFSGKTNLQYVFIAASVRGALTHGKASFGKLSIKVLMKKINKNGNKINDILQKDFVNIPETAEEDILRLIA